MSEAQPWHEPDAEIIDYSEREAQPLPEEVEWFPDTALLLSTCAKYEYLAAAAVENLDLFWPKHPGVHIATDGDLDWPGAIRKPESSFAELIQFALETIKERQPEVRYVYVLLEDLAPLGPVNEQYVYDVEKLMRAHDADYCLAPFPNSSVENIYRRLSTRLGEDGERLKICEVDPESPYFNSLVVTCWKVSHLEDVLRAKLETGETDPWSFETPVDGIRSHHYASSSCWPTLRHGLMLKGDFHPKIEVCDFGASPLLDVALARYRSTGPMMKRVRKSLSGWKWDRKRAQRRATLH